MVYGFAQDNDGDRLRAWVVLNLAMFRQHVQDGHINRWKISRQHNRKSGEEFVGYPILNIARCAQCLGAIVDDFGHPWLAYELRKELYTQPALPLDGGRS